MSRFITSRAQRAERTKQMVSKQQTSLKPTASKSRFAQARLLVLVLRRVFNHQQAHAFTLIQAKEKLKYHSLVGIQTMVLRRKQAIFQELLTYSKQTAKTQFQRKASRSCLPVFMFHFLCKILHKTTKGSFIKITIHNKNNLRERTLDICFTHVCKQFQKKLKIQTLRKLYSISFRGKARKRITPSIMKHCDTLLKAAYKIGFISIYLASANGQYQKLYGISQAQRKKFYDFESNKRQLIATQRVSLQNLKQLIDSHAYENNIKQGELKRQKAIKINQLQQNVRSLQRKLQQCSEQQTRLSASVGKVSSVVEDKRKLQILSQGAEGKVHNLFNSLKYEVDENQELKGTGSKIILNKQKFRTEISQFNKVKQQRNGFLIYLNILRKNTVCTYENIGLESMKLSSEYTRAQQQNTNLKQLINSMISYDLLKERGDILLRERNSEIENLFSNLFSFVDKEPIPISELGEGSSIKVELKQQKKLVSMRQKS